jgi:hypothetical protein
MYRLLPRPWLFIPALAHHLHGDLAFPEGSLHRLQQIGFSGHVQHRVQVFVVADFYQSILLLYIPMDGSLDNSA